MWKATDTGADSLNALCGEGWILSQSGVIAGLLVAPCMRTYVHSVLYQQPCGMPVINVLILFLT